MALQGIDQKAMFVNADDSSTMEISHDNDNIIKDKHPKKTKEVMTPQGIDQKAMSVNADGSSTKEIYFDKDIIKDKHPKKTKEVMTPQGIDQKAMSVNADGSSTKEIYFDKDIIKDNFSPETLVGCTLKFSSRKLINTKTREDIENILSSHGPLVNSWWTPDDLYFITYSTRSIAQYVFNLYKNTTN